jgi:nicotinate-nucleotide adenylyltransferase
MKIGLFFGSFNPIHVGHLIVGNAAVEQTDLDQVWFVVSPQNPFKKSKNLLHEFDRLDMVRLAIGGNSKFRASDVEFRMPKPSYTIDTLQVLKEKYPSDSFRLIIGEDNLENFRKWKDADKILNSCGLIVYPRPHSPQTEWHRSPHVQLIEAPLIDISATYIRECIRKERSIRYLVHEDVLNFIKIKKLYS